MISEQLEGHSPVLLRKQMLQQRRKLKQRTRYWRTTVKKPSIATTLMNGSSAGVGRDIG